MKSSIASVQYQLSAADLEIVLALVRTGTLAAAGERLGVDASTVFRAVQRMERGLSQRLFERSRAGYGATETAQRLAEQAEHIEAALEAARAEGQTVSGQVAGSVRISTTDTILHGLVAPSLQQLQRAQPLLDYELHTGNELASLTRRDTDIAVRATLRPPAHLVGRKLGPIRMALYGPRTKGGRRAALDPASAPWVAPDDALPGHPSVIWRKRHLPKVSPVWRVNSILTVTELVAMGCGVGILPVFLVQGRSDLTPLSDVLDECQTELWLLTHSESRHLRRVATVFKHLAETVTLP